MSDDGFTFRRPVPAAPRAAQGNGGGVYIPPPGPASNTPAPVAGPRLPIRQAPAYNDNLPPGLAQFGRGNTQFLEVLARSPLGILPFDYAVGVERQTSHGLLLTIMQAAITFEVLGADPSDWNKGYRLSGPNGPLATRVNRLIRTGVFRGNQADPAYYGLNGWYGAKTREGFKLLGRGELQALGLI